MIKRFRGPGFFVLIVFIAWVMSGTACVNVFKTSNLLADYEDKIIEGSKGRELLTKSAAAHRSNNWDSISSYSVHFEDEFFGFIGKFAHPFGQKINRFTLQYIPGTYDGRLLFKDNDQEGWGIQSWNTYKFTDHHKPVFKNDNDIKFWVPTYQYFIELPHRILSADTMIYIGKHTLEDGAVCDGVLASWKTIQPQHDIDQYIVWINSETGMIHKVDYTVREIYKFLIGRVWFQDYQDFDGFVLPTSMPVESNLVRKGFLHEMRVLDFFPDTPQPKLIRPNPDLPIMKDEKPG